MFPKGRMHFLVNFRARTAVAFSSFSTENTVGFQFADKFSFVTQKIRQLFLILNKSRSLRLILLLWMLFMCFRGQRGLYGF